MFDKSHCLYVPKLDKQEIIAIKQLAKGEASEYEQRLALKVIVNKLSRAQDLLYTPGSFDQTAFFAGRGFVGQQILASINIPVGKLEEIENG